MKNQSFCNKITGVKGKMIACAVVAALSAVLLFVVCQSPTTTDPCAANPYNTPGCPAFCTVNPNDASCAGVTPTTEHCRFEANPTACAPLGSDPDWIDRSACLDHQGAIVVACSDPRTPCEITPTGPGCWGDPCRADNTAQGCPGYCTANPTAQGCPGYCTANPTAPECGGGGGTTTKYCRFDANNLNCAALGTAGTTWSDSSTCIANHGAVVTACDAALTTCESTPTAQGCWGYVDPCTANPTAQGCPGYCTANPTAPECGGGGGTGGFCDYGFGNCSATNATSCGEYGVLKTSCSAAGGIYCDFGQPSADGNGGCYFRPNAATCEQYSTQVNQAQCEASNTTNSCIADAKNPGGPGDNAAGCNTLRPCTSPNVPAGCTGGGSDPCAGGATAACCTANPSYQGCQPTGNTQYCYWGPGECWPLDDPSGPCSAPCTGLTNLQNCQQNGFVSSSSTCADAPTDEYYCRWDGVCNKMNNPNAPDPNATGGLTYMQNCEQYGEGGVYTSMAACQAYTPPADGWYCYWDNDEGTGCVPISKPDAEDSDNPGMTNLQVCQAYGFATKSSTCADYVKPSVVYYCKWDSGCFKMANPNAENKDNPGMTEKEVCEAYGELFTTSTCK